MSTISYTNLKLKKDNSINTFNFNDTEIEVLNYLPINDKYDLLMVTLQKSKENGYYNPLKIDMYFHLHLVYMYTNLKFTDKQREDEAKLYDALQSSGFIGKLIETIPQDEYNNLYDYINETIQQEFEYNKSIGAVAAKVISDLPKSAAAAQDIIDTFDKDKYQNVIQFAQAANGNRDIKTNQPVD